MEQIRTPMTSEPSMLRPRTIRVLVWVAWGTCILLILSALPLWFLDKGSSLQLSNVMFQSIAFASFGTVGALIVSRRPKNTIGWIFCVVGIGTGLTDFGSAYSIYGISNGYALLPGSILLNWLGNSVWPLNWGLFLVFLPLLFPTGRPLTKRWRIVGWLAAIMILLAILAEQVSTVGGTLLGSVSFSNFWDNISGNISLFELPLAIAALVSLIIRFHRAKTQERQQIKWLAYGVTVMVVLIVGYVLLSFNQNGNGPFQFLFDIAILCLPISTGISILRTQLYDIDRLINRTLIYLLLTALLVLTYLALVFGLQLALQGITHDSPLPIVISTLAIAALFQPLRRAIQNVIDRSFYRSRYHAEHVVATFGMTLRDEVDVAQMSEQLLAVVQETMQPEHVSLWLNPPVRHKQPKL